VVSRSLLTCCCEKTDTRARAFGSRESKPPSQPDTPKTTEIKEFLSKFETAQKEPPDQSAQDKGQSLGDFW
jgi:hypothetical protein